MNNATTPAPARLIFDITHPADDRGAAEFVRCFMEGVAGVIDVAMSISPGCRRSTDFVVTYDPDVTRRATMISEVDSARRFEDYENLTGFRLYCAEHDIYGCRSSHAWIMPHPDDPTYIM